MRGRTRSGTAASQTASAPAPDDQSDGRDTGERGERGDPVHDPADPFTAGRAVRGLVLDCIDLGRRT